MQKCVNQFAGATVKLEMYALCAHRKSRQTSTAHSDIGKVIAYVNRGPIDRKTRSRSEKTCRNVIQGPGLMVYSLMSTIVIRISLSTSGFWPTRAPVATLRLWSHPESLMSIPFATQPSLSRTIFLPCAFLKCALWNLPCPSAWRFGCTTQRISITTRCAAHTTPPLMGGAAFYLHQPMHVRRTLFFDAPYTLTFGTS